MISDFVKGRKQYDYAEEIQHGIRLHRKIDEFTDTHAATKEAKKIFQPDYRLYSGALMDVVYDHFLANDPVEFAKGELFSFSENVYQVLEDNSMHLPAHFLVLLPYMRAENWLFHYKEREGIARSIRGLVRRAAYISDHEKAIQLFNRNYDDLQSCYDEFFRDVKDFTKHQLEQYHS